MKLEKVPGELRVKLEPEKIEQLWEKVEESGFAEAAEKTGYRRSKLYGWKSRDLFIPSRFVTEFLETAEVTAIKGRGSGQPTQNPKMDFPELNELRTRALLSSAVNREGVPVYISDDRAVAKRFVELLEKLGDVNYSVYRRERFEVRYPAHIHRFLDYQEREFDFAAAVDEAGEIMDGKLCFQNRTVPVEEFNAALYSRDKRLELALEKGDAESVQSIMEEEASKVRSAFRS